jgi:predicted ATP-grasp superfamily ATP-dependent carboligase
MDAMAAAKIIEAIDKLLPEIKIDVKPLYEQAKQIEEQLRKLRVQAKPAEPEEVSPMYG